MKYLIIFLSVILPFSSSAQDDSTKFKPFGSKSFYVNPSFSFTKSQVQHTEAFNGSTFIDHTIKPYSHTFNVKGGYFILPKFGIGIGQYFAWISNAGKGTPVTFEYRAPIHIRYIIPFLSKFYVSTEGFYFLGKFKEGVKMYNSRGNGIEIGLNFIHKQVSLGLTAEYSKLINKNYPYSNIERTMIKFSFNWFWKR